jgi:hypothetical protein
MAVRVRIDESHRLIIPDKLLQELHVQAGTISWRK